MSNNSLTIHTNRFFALVLKSPIQMGWLSIINSVTNISRLGPLSLLYLDFLTTSFLYLVVTLAPRPSIGLEIRPQNDFTAFRALLPFYWVIRSGVIVSSGLPHIKLHQTTITLCSGLSHPTGWTALPFENIDHGFFSRMEKCSEDITSYLFFMNMKGSALHVSKTLILPLGPSCHFAEWSGQVWQPLLSAAGCHI